MDSISYAVIVALLALVYSILIRKIQYKYGNQKEMETLNAESKKLNEEHKKAAARKDNKAMEEIMKKQMALFSKMWGGVFSQFKTMIPILLIFFVFSWGVGYFDPAVEDDVTIELKDDGNGCDEKVNDTVYTACYNLDGSHNSVWLADVKAYNGENVVGENATRFVVGNDNIQDTYVKQASGNAPPSVNTDKESYDAGEQIKITALLKEGNAAKATLNMGTHFYVDLPFTVPIFNFKRINEAYWWFIIVAFAASILLSVVVNKVEFLKKWIAEG